MAELLGMAEPSQTPLALRIDRIAGTDCNRRRGDSDNSGACVESEVQSDEAAQCLGQSSGRRPKSCCGSQLEDVGVVNSWYCTESWDGLSDLSLRLVRNRLALLTSHPVSASRETQSRIRCFSGSTYWSHEWPAD
ncbi:hypothetical protein IG631_14319 [Alternaria alternata]|nr:hypothetical protein IG631_14319 [Alternaria alternata]